jgi:hypothetical protein
MYPNGVSSIVKLHDHGLAKRAGTPARLLQYEGAMGGGPELRELWGEKKIQSFTYALHELTAFLARMPCGPIVVRCITAFHNGRSHIAARVSAPVLLLQALFLESRHRGFPEEW